MKDVGDQVQKYGTLDKVPAEAVGNTRNDMYLTSEAIRFLMKDKENDSQRRRRRGTQRLQGLARHRDQVHPDLGEDRGGLALGLGTMIGWKRIVVTVGEKIGKTHLTYAQGASAELVAAATIGAADMFGLPVSTTHVLSSGVAGAMAANGSGLQMATIRNMVMAWVLTLPAAILLSGTPVLDLLAAVLIARRLGRILPFSHEGATRHKQAFLHAAFRKCVSRRQRVLDQLDPVRGAEHDRLVVEIIGRMMQPGAVAVAAEDERARPLLQHVGEILRAHQRRHLVNVGVAGDFLCHLRREIGLLGMVDRHRIAGT